MPHRETKCSTSRYKATRQGSGLPCMRDVIKEPQVTWITVCCARSAYSQGRGRPSCMSNTCGTAISSAKVKPHPSLQASGLKRQRKRLQARAGSRTPVTGCTPQCPVEHLSSARACMQCPRASMHSSSWRHGCHKVAPAGGRTSSGGPAPSSWWPALQSAPAPSRPPRAP